MVVTHRPFSLGGGGSVRWRHLLRELPRHGWQITECSPRVGLTADDSSTDPRRAALAARRARLMAAAGRVVDPLTRLVGIKPEALAPNNLWSLTGRRLVRETVARANPDVVVATIPPPSALFASAREVQGIPLVADVRDLWAGNPYYDRGSALMAHLQGHGLEHAAATVTVSDGCRDRLLELHPGLDGRVHVLPNGFDPQLIGRRHPPTEHDGPRRFVFAGSLYGEHTAEAIVQALALPSLRGRASLRLVGVVDPRTRAAIAATPEAAVTTEPPVSWDDAIAHVLEADAAVAITTPATGGDMALPIKMFEALALGRPVLALARPGSDLARLLQRLGQDAGLAAPGDVAAIAAAIERLLDAPPPPVDPAALAEFDRDRIAARYAGLLEEVATRSSRRTVAGTTSSAR